MRKLTSLKVSNAVKVGKREETFFEDRMFDLQLLDDNVTVRIESKKESDAVTYTSLYNVPWFHYAPGHEPITNKSKHGKEEKEKNKESKSSSGPEDFPGTQKPSTFKW